MLVEEADGFGRDDFFLIVQRDDVVAVVQYHFSLERRGDGALDQVGALGAGDVVLFSVDDQGRRRHLAQLAAHLLDQTVGLEDALGRQARGAGGRRVADGHFAGDPGAQVFVFQAVGVAFTIGIHPAQRRVIRQRQQETVFGDAPAVVGQRGGQQRQRGHFIAAIDRQPQRQFFSYG